jgi:hypothetical protein
MEFIKQWSLCVCTALIISAVFSMFTPQGEMKRLWKIMISFFVFISFIYPLKDFDASAFKLDTQNNSFLIEESADKIYENRISSQIKEFLKSKEVQVANVSSKVKINTENGELEIKEVIIYIPDEYEKEYVSKLVFDGLGINSRVVYLGE